jgi:hypothetical protein
MLLPFCVRVCVEEINSCGIHPDFLLIVPAINFGKKELKYYTYGFLTHLSKKTKFYPHN